MLGSLRVLLIRKEFKLLPASTDRTARLRVLLIRKEFKLPKITLYGLLMFESLVNTEGFQTKDG